MYKDGISIRVTEIKEPIDIREITFYLISNTFPEQNEACVQLYIVQ
jgi:hypothetical protein